MHMYSVLLKYLEQYALRLWKGDIFCLFSAHFLGEKDSRGRKSQFFLHFTHNLLLFSSYWFDYLIFALHERLTRNGRHFGIHVFVHSSYKKWYLQIMVKCVIDSFNADSLPFSRFSEIYVIIFHIKKRYFCSKYREIVITYILHEELIKLKMNKYWYFYEKC